MTSVVRLTCIGGSLHSVALAPPVALHVAVQTFTSYDAALGAAIGIALAHGRTVDDQARHITAKNQLRLMGATLIDQHARGFL